MARGELVGLLRPLVERMHQGHHWKKTKDGPRMIAQPFTPMHLSEHAAGSVIYGLAPIAPGQSKTRVACLDLDSHKGETPFERMVEIANDLAASLEMDGYKPHLFKSSGGAGIHVYLLWREEQDAFSVRAMLRGNLATIGFKPGTGGVSKNEIEIFPKQDEVPNDGFGSMFILPWAGKSSPLGEFTRWHASADVPLRERETRSLPILAGGVSPSEAVLRSALAAIPNEGVDERSYDEWRNIGFAVHHATDGSEVGLALFHEFSVRSSKYDPEFIDNRFWPHVRADREGATITARSLFATANACGWQDPSAADDFDIVVPAEGEQAPGDAATPKRFEFLPAVLFAIAKPLRWLVKGIVPDADLTVVFGESGSGKSFWVLDLLLAIVRGVDWCSRKTIKGRCAYIAAEGAAGFRNRLNAYMQEHGLAELDLHVLPDSPSFLDKMHVKDVIARLKEIGPVAVVAVDTLAQVSPGGAENSSEDMGKVIMHCRMIRKHTGAHVVLIHHAGKDSTKGARGWSGLRAAADTEIEIVRANHDRVATITKQKDGSDGDEFGFTLRTLAIGDDGDGGVLTSCVVDHGVAVPSDRRKKVNLGSNEREVVEILKTMQEAAERVLYSDWVAATDAAMLAKREVLGEANKAAKKAREGVLDKGIVVRDGDYVRVV